MTQINATATRTSGWWVANFTVGGHEYGTQARRLDQLEHMVKDAAALMTDQPEDSFTVHIDIEGIPLEPIER